MIKNKIILLYMNFAPMLVVIGSLLHVSNVFAGKLEVENSFSKEYTQKEVVEKLMKFPRISGHIDKFEVVLNSARINLLFNRKKRSLPICKTKTVVLHTGQIEALMKSECATRFESYVSVLYFCGKRFIKTHLTKKDKKLEKAIEKAIDSSTVNTYWKKYSEISKHKKKALFVFCTAVSK